MSKEINKSAEPADSTASATATVRWIKGEPPRDGKSYLVKFKTDIIVMASWRHGERGEPNPEIKDFRCACCGKYATPEYWASLDGLRP